MGTTSPLRRLGKYELVARIGEGGMAEVHLARQRGPRSFEKIVVLKTVRPALASRPELAAMLLDEARIAALVKHPNVVDIYDLGEEGGTYFIAMEYLEGESLAQILKQAIRGQRLDPFSTARIIADCATGLHAAHELRSLAGDPLELVHQDVTPGNVIVLYTGQTKLVDFGVARVRTSADDGMIKGKTGYLAPEVIDGAQPDRRSDVWSLGVVLWEALTLRRLFSAKTEEEQLAKIRAAEVAPPSSLISSVPRDLDEVVTLALTRDPAKRYQTAQAMQADLMQILRHASWSGGSEPIARFMRSAFADRIEARRVLLKELATRKAARVETLERLDAMSEEPSPAPGADAQVVGSHGTGMRPRTPTSLPLPAPEITQSRAIVEVADVEAAEPDGGEEMIIDVDGLGAPSGVTPLPTVRTTTLRRRGVAAAVVVVAALAVVGLAAALTGGGSGARAAIDAGPGPTITALPPDAAVEPDATVELAAAVPSEPEPVPEVEARSDEPPRSRRDRDRRDRDRDRDKEPEPARAGGTAKSLYKDGLQKFVAGDVDAAVKLFEASLDKSKGYAPAYRGLGMAYERRGDRRRAIRAFETYLRLAPRASDAASIQARLDKLR